MVSRITSHQILKRRSMGRGWSSVAITSANQPRNINRAHPCPHLVSESTEER